METQRSKQWSVVSTAIIPLMLQMAFGTRIADYGEINTMKGCLVDNKTKFFTVVPGSGWDNLRNVEMLSVLQNNFSECRRSLDGKYYIPNSMKLIPKMSTNLELFSEVFTNFRSYRSLTASSINVESSYSGSTDVSGSFSAEHQTVKSGQINGKAITTRVQMRHHLFTVMSGQQVPLDRQFGERLMDIAFQLDSNNTIYGDFLADLLVADYGTHVITRVDAGGVLWKMDSIKTESRTLSVSERTAITASASVGFKKIFKVKTDTSHDRENSNTKGYDSKVTSQKVGTYGGLPMRFSTTLEEWTKSVESHLVAIDRAGLPISAVISPSYLGHLLSYRLVERLRQRVVAAVTRYHRANAIHGCTDPDSPNFDPRATVSNQDCDSKSSKGFNLGGIFQECREEKFPEHAAICGGHQIKNTITGKLSCQKGYRKVLLASRQFFNQWHCVSIWMGLKSKCRYHTAVYSIYWCAANSSLESPKSGHLFGGVYSSGSPNLATDGESCPPTFDNLTLGNGDLSVCLSRDFKVSGANSHKFGGFFSCRSGNLYSLPEGSDPWRGLDDGQLPRKCPRGFSQHMIGMDGDCELMYCTKVGKTNDAVGSLSARRGPFVQLPMGSIPRPRAGMVLAHTSGDDSEWHCQDNIRLRQTIGALASLVATLVLAAPIVFLVLRKRWLRKPKSEKKAEEEGPPVFAVGQGAAMFQRRKALLQNDEGNATQSELQLA